MSLRFATPDSTCGAYRWYYADASAGDLTAVAIFMIGTVFSPRYAAAGTKGRPLEHCAVNFALYRSGVRQAWVFSGYRTATLHGPRLQIGQSSLAYGPDGSVQIQIADRTAPWGRPLAATLNLWPACPTAEAVALVPGHSHQWQALAARCRSALTVSDGEPKLGSGYHDTNWGSGPLGTDLPGWSWTRVHRAGATEVRYRPCGSGDELRLSAYSDRVEIERSAPDPSDSARTWWGLRVPRDLGASGESPKLLESSPFYARLESQSGSAHALAEVADFARFARPSVRWMAHFRSRDGRAT